MTLKTAALPDGKALEYHYADFERRYEQDNGTIRVRETTTYWRTLARGVRDETGTMQHIQV
jgi:hypothetical protein